MYVSGAEFSFTRLRILHAMIATRSVTGRRDSGINIARGKQRFATIFFKELGTF